MNIDELCTEVNRILIERGVVVADGRTSSVVTPRNVRYYCSLGLVQPPVRDGKRAKYELSHVDDIVAIKSAQVNGVTLEQILKLRDTAINPVVTRKMIPNFEVKADMHVLRHNSELFQPKLNSTLTSLKSWSSLLAEASLSEQHEPLGWSVRIGDVTVSGQGEPPSTSQIAQIKIVLNRVDPD